MKEHLYKDLYNIVHTSIYVSLKLEMLALFIHWMHIYMHK